MANSIGSWFSLTALLEGQDLSQPHQGSVCPNGHTLERPKIFRPPRWANPYETRMKAESAKPVRCAIYTRVSDDSGFGQDFNSLDAQRDSSEAYIRSQAHASCGP